MFGLFLKTSSDRTAAEEQSLQDFFDRLAPQAKLTLEEVRAQMDAREARARERILIRHGLTEGSLSKAPENVRSDVAKDLMYELAHSPEAKQELRAYQAATAQESFLKVKGKAEEILARQRRTSRREQQTNVKTHVVRSS